MTTKKLSNTMRRGGGSVYETEDLRNTLLLHMDLIRSREANSSVEITQHEADKWYGDFYGLLQSKGVQPHMYWLLTAFNGLSCSSDYDSDFLEIKTVDADYILQIVNIHNTVFR